jgi:hypothetical protein
VVLLSGEANQVLFFFATFLPWESRRLAVLGYKITTLKWQVLHPIFFAAQKFAGSRPFFWAAKGLR